MQINCQVVDGKLIPSDLRSQEALKEFESDAIYTVKISKSDKRTLAQNSSLHLWCNMIASKLNKEKMTIQHVIKLNSVWCGDRVKELIFKPTVEHLYDKKSTTKLNKDEFDLIIDTITKYLGEKGIECPEFPSKER